MGVYFILLAILILINIFRLIRFYIRTKNKAIAKDKLVNIWKLFFNNVLIVAIYYIVKSYISVDIAHLQDYFIGIIVAQILLITAVRDGLLFLKRTGLIKVVKAGLIIILKIRTKNDHSKDEEIKDTVRKYLREKSSKDD